MENSETLPDAPGATEAPPSTNDATRTNHNETSAPVNGSLAVRPVFLGNVSHTATPMDLNLLFERPIVPIPYDDNSGDPKDPFPVDRVDLKRGFCFVFLKDVTSQTQKDRTDRYVSEINGMHVERVSKQLRAEYARGDGRIKRKEDARRATITPSETLFVVNFHEETTKREDLQMLFEPYGELVRIDMKRNYAFVQFANTEESRRAKEATNGGKLDQSVITVEYVARKMGDRDGRGRDRDRRDRSYDRGGPRRDPHGFPRDRLPPPGYDRDRDHHRGRDRYDDYPPTRGPPRDDRYDDPPPSRDFRGRGRSADRLLREYEPYYRGRSRSRSRSPAFRRRSRSPPPRRDYERDRDEYRRGGRVYEDERRRSRSYERTVERGASRDRDRFRSDDRGYGGGTGGRNEAADT